MKIPLILVSFLFAVNLHAQDIFGNWKTIKEETGEARSIVNIYQEDGKVFGKITRIFEESKRDKRCTKCKGEDKDEKVEGLVLLKNFTKEDDEFVDGTITNPVNGKVYDSKMWLDEENPDILNIRGYVGFFYKTVHWERVD